MSTLPSIILAAVVGLAIGHIVYHVAAYLNALAKKATAEIQIAHEQANHIKQTAAVEFANLESTQRAFEKQGANKLRTEIARLGGDLAKIETLIGSKLNAISLTEHKRQIEEALHASGAVVDSQHPVYAGQPSPGSNIPA